MYSRSRSTSRSLACPSHDSRYLMTNSRCCCPTERGKSSLSKRKSANKLILYRTEIADRGEGLKMYMCFERQRGAFGSTARCVYRVLYSGFPTSDMLQRYSPFRCCISHPHFFSQDFHLGVLGSCTMIQKRHQCQCLRRGSKLPRASNSTHRRSLGSMSCTRSPNAW
jgi:hypothetical protein